MNEDRIIFFIGFFGSIILANVMEETFSKVITLIIACIYLYKFSKENE